MDQCLARIQDSYLGGLLLPHYDGYSWTFWCRVCCGLCSSILLLLTHQSFSIGTLGWGPGIALFTVFGLMAG
jgi:hypothetical protein